jgi:Fe2+ transport system protein FeoA
MPLATKSQLPYFRFTVNNSTLNSTLPGSGGTFLFPLSQVQAGHSVRIKQVSGSPEVTSRLREMGFCEEQKIRLISRHSHVICQVCHARLGISTQLAEKILVEPLAGQKAA